MYQKFLNVVGHIPPNVFSACGEAKGWIRRQILRRFLRPESAFIKSLYAKKVDFKIDSFLSLFTDIHLGTYWRLLYSFKSRFSYIQYILEDLPLPFGAWGLGERG